MDRKNMFAYGHASRMIDIEAQFVAPDNVPELVQDRHDAKDSFLSIVFSVDPLTKLPTGDLQYMVSDKVNPEVKQWVIQNLLLDTSAAKAPAAPRGLSDDDVMALVRQPNESSQAYMNRVNMFAKTNQEIYDRLAKVASDRSGSEKPNVSTESGSSSVSSE